MFKKIDLQLNSLVSYQELLLLKHTIMSQQEIICRFQTTPPMPFLKFAITLSPNWPIQQLINKIHHTLLNEPEYHSHYLLPCNPLLVLERWSAYGFISKLQSQQLTLNIIGYKGCRIPITESCSIIIQQVNFNQSITNTSPFN